MMLFWVLIIIGIVYLISRSGHGLFSDHNNHPRRDYRAEHDKRPNKDKYRAEGSNRFAERNYNDQNIKRTKSPEDIAKERLAKGEIDKEEYKEILKEINR